jgi:hypothetical protein
MIKISYEVLSSVAEAAGIQVQKSAFGNVPLHYTRIEVKRESSILEGATRFGAYTLSLQDHILTDDEIDQVVKNLEEKFLRDQEQKRLEKEAEAAAVLAAKEMADRAYAEAVNLDWKRGKVVLDLKEKLFTVARMATDRRWKHWAKEITAIDSTQNNAYMFMGLFVNDGTVEITSDDKVYLLASETGSNKYRTTTYRVVTLQGGQWVVTDIVETDEKAGWALRIRDRVASLIEQAYGGSTDRVTEAIKQADHALTAQENIKKASELANELLIMLSNMVDDDPAEESQFLMVRDMADQIVSDLNRMSVKK